MNHSSYLEMNRIGWDRRARAHLDSRFYDVDGFLAGRSSLREIELAELPELSGKRVLHLQCHFGLDTLSLARLGARCTGVDLSPVAIEQARALAARSGIEADFVCSDVCGFEPDRLAAFDFVYTSYGAVCWLPELAPWAAVIADNLAPGGTFYMAEFHPVYDLVAGHSYFTRAEPDVQEEPAYTEHGAEVMATFATWAHPFSSVINALVGAGVRIERLNEFPFSPYDCFAGLEEREPGRYFLARGGQDVPLVYTITGRKVASPAAARRER